MRLDMCKISGQLVRIANSKPASATNKISLRVNGGEAAQRSRLAPSRAACAGGRVLAVPLVLDWSAN
jgi:hypothetical protein